MKKVSLIFLICFCIAHSGAAQQEKRWIKQRIITLSGSAYHGRGYVGKGMEKAANYLAKSFSDFGLQSFLADSSYLQPYSFSVNTFPNAMYLKLNKTDLTPGADYIINAASSGCDVEGMSVKNMNLKNIKDSASWLKLKARFDGSHTYLLKHYDTLQKYLHLNSRSLAKSLPKGVYLIPVHGKMTWTVAQDTTAATLFYVQDTVMRRRTKRITATVQNKLVPDFESNNVIGFVPGVSHPDSFLLFTAHFDHLGMMGRAAMFPGAHDNASGTALMLYLANYFAQHPQKYTMVFIGFSGEEAGLVGSEYFVRHPLFPLGNIRQVINMDMVGDATDGITIVNGVQQKETFALLNAINDEHKYLPRINRRDQTKNSDHYYFSEAGVPAIFIYGMGAKGFYHDIFDKANELSLNNIEQLAQLLIDFAGKI